MNKKRSLFIISGPSGAGKSVFAAYILKKFKKFKRVTTYTTRPPREGELHGSDYHFISNKEFLKMIKENKFFEWAGVYGKFYGNSKEDIAKVSNEGKIPLLILDVQGSLKVKKLYPESFLLFTGPQTLDELKQRLVARGKDSIEVIGIRLKTACREWKSAKYFDCILFNRDLKEGYSNVNLIVRYFLKYL